MINQTLRGLVGQSLTSGRGAFPGYSRTFPASASAYTWSPPAGGTYEIAAWGCGTVSQGGVTGTGAFALKTVTLAPNQRLSITSALNIQVVTPAGGTTGAVPDTTVTLPNGTVITAGSATPSGSPGAASNGDVNVAGTAGTTSAIAGPSYASAYNTYTGGGASGNRGATPGGASGTTTQTYGSDGLVIINRIA